MEEERETLLEGRKNKNKKSSSLKGYSIVEDRVESKNFLMWVFLDQSSLWRAGLAWSIFFLLAIGVPLLSHFVFQCSNCEETHRRPYDDIVQLSLSIFSMLSFISLSSFTRKYGLRKFLFLDKLCDVSQKVRQGYTLHLHVSSFLLSTSYSSPCKLIYIIIDRKANAFFLIQVAHTMNSRLLEVQLITTIILFALN